MARKKRRERNERGGSNGRALLLSLASCCCIRRELRNRGPLVAARPLFSSFFLAHESIKNLKLYTHAHTDRTLGNAPTKPEDQALRGRRRRRRAAGVQVRGELTRENWHAPCPRATAAAAAPFFLAARVRERRESCVRSCSDFQIGSVAQGENGDGASSLSLLHAEGG